MLAYNDVINLTLYVLISIQREHKQTCTFHVVTPH